VKITPAHDPNDFEVGKRHNLELVQVIDFDGKMINVPGQFVGMTALEARKRVLAALEIDELLRGEKDIEHQVGHCYKCGSVIEPLAKEQWFVKMRQLADNAIAAIERKEVTFTPENKGDVVIKYLKDIKDWNISRQIPWGIPIPMFQSKTNLDDWRYSTEVDKKEIVVDGTTYRREEDTLDTWFSSGQWPYITTDYLDAGKLAKYYPNTVMETAGDILFAWVARMIMLGLYRTGQVPFKHVYLHGLVLDEKGIKMSKSKGNVINPMETVAKYGSDALRMGIIASRSAAQPQAFNTGKVVAARNFCNKLWNIARYTENLVGDRTPAASPQLQSLADHWIARQLDEAAQSLDRQIATYHFAEAGETIYHTVWDDVADWYIEASKVEQNIDMNAYVLDTILRLTHPFAPFLTETIWQALPWHDTILASETMPDRLEYDDIAAAAFGRLKDLVSEARYVVSELPGNKRYGLLYMDDSLVADNIELVKKLARVTSVEHVDQARGLRLAASGRDVWLDIDDETLYEHQANLEKRLAEERQHIRTLETRLANDNYVAKAPAALVEESRKTLREKQELITRLQNELQVVSNK
jgi:aminoacyl-tRNA synthetase, class Ia